MRYSRAVTLVLLLSVTSLLTPAVRAQSQNGTYELTVEALVIHALSENPALQAARMEIDAAQGRRHQAGLRPNPMLELGVQQSVTGPDNNLMAGVTVPLELGGRKAGRVGVAERALEFKRAQVADRERQLRAEVRLKAGELLATQRNLRFTRELLQINRDALGLLRRRVSQGAAPPLEARLLLVEVNRLDASLVILESQSEVLTLQVKTLAGLEPEAPLALRGNLHPITLSLNPQEGMVRALAERPDLMMFRAEVAMAQASIRKERAEGRWDASLNLGYMRQDFGYDLRGLTEHGNTQAIHDIFHYVGGGVTIMLPLRNQNQGNIAAAVSDAMAAERRLEFATQTIRQEVAAAFTQYAAAHQALEIYTQGVREVARENLDVVRKAYELGRTSLLDLISEQRRYIEVETDYTVALQQAYNAAVDVARSVGELDR